MKIKATIRSVVSDKKNVFRAIAVALVFLYSFVLIVLCESLSRGSLGEMISFIGNSPTDAIFVNCSVLTALAILFLWLITTKLSVSVGLVSVSSISSTTSKRQCVPSRFFPGTSSSQAKPQT